MGHFTWAFAIVCELLSYHGRSHIYDFPTWPLINSPPPKNNISARILYGSRSCGAFDNELMQLPVKQATRNHLRLCRYLELKFTLQIRAESAHGCHYLIEYST